MKLVPLFTWAGGKRRMMKHHLPHAPKEVTLYAEPFLGGGAMFCEMQHKFPDAQFHLNDSNEGIMRIYRAIRDDCHTFCLVVDELQRQFLQWETKEARKEFYTEILRRHASKDADNGDKASYLYFLMRTCFNGIWQPRKDLNGEFGTPPGLCNQKERVYDREMVEQWHHVLNNSDVHLTALDFETWQCPPADNETFVYLDPPYRGCHQAYGVRTDDEFQTEVFRRAAQYAYEGGRVLICNRDLKDGFIQGQAIRHFGGDLHYSLHDVDVTYTAGRRKKVGKGFEAKKAQEIFLVSGGL